MTQNILLYHSKVQANVNFLENYNKLKMKRLIWISGFWISFAYEGHWASSSNFSLLCAIKIFNKAPLYHENVTFQELIFQKQNYV